jgi:hypothetical protein
MQRVTWRAGCIIRLWMFSVNDKHMPEKEQLESGAEAFTRCDVSVGGASFTHSDGTEVATIQRGLIPQYIPCTGKMTRLCQSGVGTESRQTHQRRRGSIIPEPRTDSRPQIRIESTPTCWRTSTNTRRWLDVTARCCGTVLSPLTTSQT